MIDQPQPHLLPLGEALRSGALSLSAYLDQLEARFAAREPEVLAFVPETGRFERLRREAAALETRYPDPATRPPLFGLPVGVKDIFHADGFVTQAGSRVPPDLLAGPEATSVSQLKAAGALIMGKTVTTEFAYFGPGPTRNPHHPAHTPGGSSSGSAAAVGAGMCPLAVGTQTIGSIVRPAAFCGVVGFKPSYERISREGVIPLAPAVDHIGVFTADVAGAALVAGVLCQGWNIGTLRVTTERPVLGVPEGPYLAQASAEGLAHFQAVQTKLTQAGFEIKAVPALADFDTIYAEHNLLVAAEAAQTHQSWFSDFSGLYHPKTADLIERGQQVSAEALEAARAGRGQLRRVLAEVMREYKISAWLAPSAPGPAPATLESTGNPVMNLPWTYAGLPAINLPAGANDNGLPLGVQVVGGWQEDEQLLGWASQLEPVVRA